MNKLEYLELDIKSLTNQMSTNILKLPESLNTVDGLNTTHKQLSELVEKFNEVVKLNKVKQAMLKERSEK